MSDRVPHRCLAASTGLLAMVAATAFIGMADAARADTAEYLAREFRTERPTVTASLSSIDDEDARPARHPAPRVSITRSNDDRPRRKRHTKAQSRTKYVRVASLGKTYVPPSKPQRSITDGGSIKWAASSGCLNGSLRGVLAQVASRFGSVTVNSTCRSRSRNARVGGAHRSKHLTGNAADFRINGNWGAASSFIRSLVGGFKHYGGGLFHIDTGPRRTW